MAEVTKYPYTEGNQFRGYISQFMRVFSGFQYKKNAKGDLGTVPVVYGGMERMIAHLMSNGTDHLRNDRLPMLAVNMTGISSDPNGKRSPRHQDKIKNRVNDEPSFTNRIIGPAFDMELDVSIYASSTTELFQILEQILLIYNPRVTINVDSFAENGDYLTDISLTSIQNEINSPLGTEQQVVSFTLGFTVPVRLRYPMNIDRDGIIELIKLKTVVSGNDEIISHIDEDGVHHP